MEKYYLKTVPLLRKNKENIYNFENNLFLLDIIFSFYCDRNSINNDYTQKMHAHSYYEMHIISEGESTFELPSKRLLSLKKGDFIIFPTDYKHRITYESNRFSKISVSFNFSPKETPEKNFYQVAKKHIQDPAIIGLNQQMSNHCDTIIYNIEKKPYDYTSIIFFSMIQLIIESFRLKVGDAEIEYAEFFTDNRIKAATDFIKENINASLNVQDVANHVHLSAKQLVRLFKKETSTTPGEYIKSQKIACIREMIANDMNIKDIVYAMGYSDYTSLIKFYKRYSGDSLASYKKTLAYKEKTAEQSMMI